MLSFLQFIKESKDSTVKGWIHPKTKKVYLTKRLRPYHVEFIAKKPRDFGTNDKEILDVLEKWNDSMDAPKPRDSANAGYPDSKLVKLLVGDKILRALRGKQTGDKRTEIGQTMAMFRT